MCFSLGACNLPNEEKPVPGSGHCERARNLRTPVLP